MTSVLRDQLASLRNEGTSHLLSTNALRSHTYPSVHTPVLLFLPSLSRLKVAFDLAGAASNTKPTSFSLQGLFDQPDLAEAAEVVTP